MSDVYWLLAPVLFIIALTYSSVGLGGGTSYGAFLYLLGFPLAKIPPLALFFNVIAASVALYRFRRYGYFSLKLTLPFIISSIPVTFFSARLRLDGRVFAALFSLVLFSTAFALLFKRKEVKRASPLSPKIAWVLSLSLGAFLGFLSGVMGIGGGIFLGAALLLMGFASSRHVACISSAFVLVNSCIGLASHYLQGRLEISAMILLGLTVFAGAQVGSFLGTKKFSPLMLQRILALLLILVSVKIGFGALR